MRKILLTALACAVALAFVDPAEVAKKKGDPAVAPAAKKKGKGKGRKGPRIPPESQFQQALTRLAHCSPSRPGRPDTHSGLGVRRHSVVFEERGYPVLRRWSVERLWSRGA